jgi:hypothetical protein
MSWAALPNGQAEANRSTSTGNYHGVRFSTLPRATIGWEDRIDSRTRRSLKPKERNLITAPEMVLGVLPFLGSPIGK